MNTTHPITLETVRRDPQVIAFLQQANANLRALGYTEHGQRHAGIVAKVSHDLLVALDQPPRLAELAAIAGYIHDIGNVVHRENHALSGAGIACQILTRLGMDWNEMALVMNAIGNHEEERGTTTNAVAAALVIADKSDVDRSRVQEQDPLKFDIHDRVNYAVEQAMVRVSEARDEIHLSLRLNETSSVMEYFEIFLSRMLMSRNAAQTLGCRFVLIINDYRLF